MVSGAAQLPEHGASGGRPVQERHERHQSLAARATALAHQAASSAGVILERAKTGAKGGSRGPLALSRGRRPATTSSSVTPSRTPITLFPGRGPGIRPTPTSQQPTSTTADPVTTVSSTTTTESTIISTTDLSSQSDPATLSTSSSTAPVATGTRYPADPDQEWFLAGACMGTLPRCEALPDRRYLNYEGTSEADPVKLAAGVGMNAMRINTLLKLCTGPTLGFDNSDGWAEREKHYSLDWGCNDLQTPLALRAKAQGMKLIHALDIGKEIPVAWQGLSYKGMLEKLWDETVRQVRPIVQAGIQPDYIILGTEETDGMLFTNSMNGTDYINGRGMPNDYKSTETLYSELCGIIPTGNTASWPQLAGYYKQMILAARSVISDGGFDASKTLFGLHSHGQYFGWKNSIVYNTDPNAETSLQTPYGLCDYKGIIPQNLLDLKVADMLDIMGFSGYPNPMHPVSNSPGDVSTALQLVTEDLTAAQAVADRYGKTASGRYRKQILVLEVAFQYQWWTDEALQDTFTGLYFDTLKQYPATLGALWWEPTYGRNYWEGGQAALYRESDDDWKALTPIGPSKTFYSYAISK